MKFIAISMLPDSGTPVSAEICGTLDAAKAWIEDDDFCFPSGGKREWVPEEYLLIEDDSEIYEAIRWKLVIDGETWGMVFPSTGGDK